MMTPMVEEVEEGGLGEGGEKGTGEGQGGREGEGG